MISLFTDVLFIANWQFRNSLVLNDKNMHIFQNWRFSHWVSPYKPTYFRCWKIRKNWFCNSIFDNTFSPACLKNNPFQQEKYEGTIEIIESLHRGKNSCCSRSCKQLKMVRLGEGNSTQNLPKMLRWIQKCDKKT